MRSQSTTRDLYGPAGGVDVDARRVGPVPGDRAESRQGRRPLRVHRRIHDRYLLYLGSTPWHTGDLGQVDAQEPQGGASLSYKGAGNRGRAKLATNLSPVCLLVTRVDVDVYHEANPYEAKADECSGSDAGGLPARAYRGEARSHRDQ